MANPTATYAVNIDQDKTWGLELATGIPLSAEGKPNLNYTWTDTEAIVAYLRTLPPPGKPPQREREPLGSR